VSVINDQASSPYINKRSDEFCVNVEGQSIKYQRKPDKVNKSKRSQNNSFPL
jgi:hypothetical protein